MTDLPIACRLTAAELRQRRERLAGLAEIIDLERRCCPFLTFRLTVEPSGGPVSLAITGPAGTGRFLETELGLRADCSKIGPENP